MPRALPTKSSSWGHEAAIVVRPHSTLLNIRLCPFLLTKAFLMFPITCSISRNSLNQFRPKWGEQNKEEREREKFLPSKTDWHPSFKSIQSKKSTEKLIQPNSGGHPAAINSESYLLCLLDRQASKSPRNVWTKIYLLQVLSKQKWLKSRKEPVCSQDFLKCFENYFKI